MKARAQPRTVLIGWELGAGEGHLARLVPIVRALREQGCYVIAAVRDMSKARRILATVGGRDGPGQFVLGQAPIFLHRATRKRACCSLPEILAEIGFADAELIRPVFDAWVALLRRFRPDVVISDMAPTLNIAAQDRTRVIAIGNGWTLPPALAPLPPLRADPHFGIPSSTAEEMVCQALTAASGHRVDTFADTLRGSANFVFTAPWLDPYKMYRGEPHYWPPEIPVLPQRAERNGPALVYLPAGHPSAESLVSELERQNIKAHAYLGGTLRSSGKNVTITSRPIDFEKLLPSAPFIAHHGGLGTANFALSLGIPQMILPTDLEKSLIGESIFSNKCGIIVNPKFMLQCINKISRRGGQNAFITYKMDQSFSPDASISALIKETFNEISRQPNH